MTKNEFNNSLKNINLFAFDVDGVFTDGLPVTIQNAHPEVKKICKYTTIKTGGHGAVREICDLLINARKKRQEE